MQPKEMTIYDTLGKATVKRLRADAENVRATAERKGTTMDSWEEKNESHHAKIYFELGCYLYYYRKLISKPDDAGLQHRINCLEKIFLAGFDHLNYEFFTVFDFGEREFDTIFEMGDSEKVINGLRARAAKDSTGSIERAFAYCGWPLELSSTPVSGN